MDFINRVKELCKERGILFKDLAALFIESALGISAELLMGLQSDYTMQHTRNDAEVKRKLRSPSLGYFQEHLPSDTSRNICPHCGKPIIVKLEK